MNNILKTKLILRRKWYCINACCTNASSFYTDNEGPTMNVAKTLWAMRLKPLHLVEQCWWQGQLQLCSDFRRRIILACRFWRSDTYRIVTERCNLYNGAMYNQHSATTRRIEQATDSSTSRFKSLSVSLISLFSHLFNTSYVIMIV